MIFSGREAVAEIAEVSREIGGEMWHGNAVGATAAGVGLHALKGGVEDLKLCEFLNEIFHKLRLIYACT